MQDNSKEVFSFKDIKLTYQQLSFIAQGNYGFVNGAGKSVYRELKPVAQDKQTGNIIVKETYSGEYTYQKSFLLSPEGRQEKLRYQTNPLKRS